MFRREFQLSPVPESSASAAYGWPCIIASEMLTIAPYTGMLITLDISGIILLSIL